MFTWLWLWSLSGLISQVAVYCVVWLFLDDLPNEYTYEDIKAELLQPKSILTTLVICQLTGPLGAIVAIFTGCSITWARLKEKDD